MRVLITGGLGYLGSYLARELAGRLGCDVRLLAATVPPALESWREEFEIVEADVTRAEQLGECCRGCDAVLHLAALDREEARADPARALLVSGAGTRNVLTAAAEAGIARVVYFSTVHVYGPARGSVGEDSPVAPADDYSIAHYLGELYCERARALHGLGAVRLRIANGFGAPVHRDVRCWSLVLHDFCRAALDRQEIVIRSHGVQRRDFLPISDVRQVVELLLTAPPNRVRHALYNVGSGAPVSINEVAARVARVFREEARTEVAILHRPSSSCPASEPTATLSLARVAELGFRPAPAAAMDDEIRRIFALLRSG